MNGLQVALQLYTVRDETQQDFAGTIRRVAAMGYEGVEFAGFGGLSDQEMNALLAETGLCAAGAHIGIVELTDKNLETSLAYCRAIGCSSIALPWLAPEFRTVEGIRELAPRLNAIGERCRQAGITFAYHNHDFEFTDLDGRTWYDYLLDATDPALVKVELDVYWAAHAGHDPLALLQRLGNRVALVHCKDQAANGEMTEVGQGTLDMSGMTAFAQQQGIWAVVEHDHPTLPSLESARISLEYFQQR
jgi:sugar phosphate isomerase/epimerase